MGTSASRSGSNSSTGGAWTTAKTRASRFAGGTGSSAAGVVSGYAAALAESGGASGGAGGTGGGVGSSRVATATRVGQGLGAFMGDVGSRGLDAALRERGLEQLIGKSAEEVLAGIADHIAGNGGPLDEAIARATVVEVLTDIFDEEQDEYDQLQKLLEDRLDGDGFKEILRLFLSKSIFEMLLADMADRFEENGDSTSEILRKERQIEQFIEAMVEFDLGQADPLRFDWAGAEGKALVERNLAAAIEQLEVLDE